MAFAVAGSMATAVSFKQHPTTLASSDKSAAASSSSSFARLSPTFRNQSRTGAVHLNALARVNLTGSMGRTFLGQRVGPRAASRLRVSAAQESQTTPAGGEGLTESTLDIVRSVIAEQLAIPVASVESHTKFADLGADSLDTVEIMMNLEEKFGVTIEDEGAEKLTTVKDASDLIEVVRRGRK